MTIQRRDFHWNMEEFLRIRKAPALVEDLEARGREWTERLNTELHEAQAKRGQPVEDGYDYHVTTNGTRARLYVETFTARAAAHEARHQSLLKNVVIGEAAHAGTPVDPDLPEELAKRVTKRAAAHKRKYNTKVKKWLRAEAQHRMRNLSVDERADIARRINRGENPFA